MNKAQVEVCEKIKGKNKNKHGDEDSSKTKSSNESIEDEVLEESIGSKEGTKSIDEINKTLKNAKATMFTVIPKDMFVRNIGYIKDDGNYKDSRDEICRILSGPIDKKAIASASELLKALNGSFEDRLELLKSRLNNYVDLNMKGFKKGDKFDKGKFDNDIRPMIRSIFVTAERENASNRERITRITKSILDKLGISIYISTKNSIKSDYHGNYEKETKARLEGKIDKEPLNSSIFFTYDINDIYGIIEGGLGVKLNNNQRSEIAELIDRETRDIRYKTSIAHGTGGINEIISKIESYINSRKRDSGSIFRFSEMNRFVLKEMLKKMAPKREPRVDIMAKLRSLKI